MAKEKGSYVKVYINGPAMWTTVALILLKLLNIAAFSWLWIFSPLWIVIAISTLNILLKKTLHVSLNSGGWAKNK
jgi:hypothetical protein